MLDTFSSLVNSVNGGLADFVHVDGLLHLATFTSAVTIGYVGLDRIGGAEQTKNIEDMIEHVKSGTKDLLLAQKSILFQDDGSLDPYFEFPGMHHLCNVGDIPVTLPSERSIKFKCFFRALCRQYHFPLLAYYRHRCDLKIVGLMALISTLSFLFLSAASIWTIPWLANKTVCGTLLSLYGIILLWVLASVSASYKLKRMSAICSNWFDEIKRRTDEFFQKTLRLSLAQNRVSSAEDIVRKEGVERKTQIAG